MAHSSGYGENIEEYEVLGVLGKGGFATVYRARSKRNNDIVAIKMIDKKLIHRAGLTNRVRQEVEIHSRLKHPFVVELYTFFQDVDFVYLVMELASNGELQRYMKEHMNRPMTENEAASILQQVVSGILYLHSHQIMHRDISLSNLLITKDMNVKIADFGLAAQLKQSDEKHLTMCGTPNFISPEVASRSSHGLPADVWAIGCLLYTLLVGRPPFDTHGIQATLTKVVISNYCLPNHLSHEAKDLINKLLKKNPIERIALENINNHPFMLRFKRTTNLVAAGTVAMNTFTNENESNFGLFQKTSTPTSSCNNYSNSCDSGIITFASSASANSFRPTTLRSDDVFEQHNRNYNITAASSNTTSPIHTAFSGFQNVTNSAVEINWQTKNTFNHQNQWHMETPPQFQKNTTNTLLSTKQQVEETTVSQMIAGIPTSTPVSSIVNLDTKQKHHLSVPPLSTKRLQPTRFRNKSAIMSILNDGEVVIEFIKYRSKLNEDRITDVCWISKDGQRIVIYEPDPGRGLPILDAQQPKLPQHDTRVEIFNYDNLPQKHWRKYLFASRFVNLVKASTPKVTLFSDQAKFHLMESSNFECNEIHFEAIFYDGSKITKTPNEGLRIFERHGRLLQPEEHISEMAGTLLEHQEKCLRHCQDVCKALEMIQYTNVGEEFSYFPIVIGRRPTTNRNRIGKINETSTTPVIYNNNHNHHHHQSLNTNRDKTKQILTEMPLNFNTFPKLTLF